MSRLPVIHTLFDYHFAMYQRIWESINQLTDEQFLQAVPYSHGSVRNQMVHVVAAEARWLLGLKGDQAARRFTITPETYPDRQSVWELWHNTSNNLRAYIDSLEESNLESVPPGMFGPAWQVLHHLINHGTDHRAQILHTLHDLGVPTFDQDLILYLWRV